MNILNIIAFVVIIIIGLIMAHNTNQDSMPHHEYRDPDLEKVKHSLNEYRNKHSQNKQRNQKN